jgi:signal transduction histidine kinase
LYQHGLAAAIEWLAAQTRKHHNVQVTVKADSSVNPKAFDVRVFLFQAVRELLLNAVKHAAGSPVRIAMTNSKSNKVQIIVADRGPGFDPATLDRPRTGSGGLGLFSIRERVASFEGELRMESAPGRGTQITLVAPCG